MFQQFSFKFLKMNRFDLHLFFLAVGIFISSGTLFLYCYFGVFVTNNFLQYADCLYETSWYELQIKFQKYMIMMIMNGQRVLVFNGFGLITMNLETFTNVCIESFWIFCLTITPFPYSFFAGHENCCDSLFNVQNIYVWRRNYSINYLIIEL